jgi:hypothetical protein
MKYHLNNATIAAAFGDIGRDASILRNTMSDQNDIPTAVTIGRLEYRARCTEPECRNLARLGLRYSDSGGRPITQLELCFAHGNDRIERDGAAGLKIYDNRVE